MYKMVNGHITVENKGGGFLLAWKSPSEPEASKAWLWLVLHSKIYSTHMI